MPVSKDWPADLPFEPLRAAWQMKERFAPNQTHDTEQGPGRQRPTASAIWSVFAYKIVMTEAEAERADSFLLNDLRQASLRFRMKVGRIYQPASTWAPKVCMVKDGVYTIEPFGDRLSLVIPDLKVLDY